MIYFFLHLVGDKLPTSAWLVSKLGRLTAGVQYEPQCKYVRNRNDLFLLCSRHEG